MRKEGFLKLSYVFIGIMVFCAVGCKMPWDSSGVPEPAIRIIPQNQNVSANNDFSVEIKANNVSNIFATPFYLVYDTNFLKFNTATEGTFLNRNNKDSTTFLFSNDPVRGRIIVGLTRLGQVPGISGSGLLMTVHFKAIKIGASNIDFANASAKITIETDPIPKATPMNFIGSIIDVR